MAAIDKRSSNSLSISSLLSSVTGRLRGLNTKGGCAERSAGGDHLGIISTVTTWVIFSFKTAAP
ncbi:hypothetical protein C7B70_21050 [Chlorogloea sp. CCALA 695]|nr:hypothetical protein C7B70_21050 [Chlorogloea sp. CCALA 695]